MSAMYCSYPGHAQFFAAIVVFDDTIATVMICGRIIWYGSLVTGGVVLRRVQAFAEVVGDVAILSHRTFHLVDLPKWESTKTSSFEAVVIREQVSRVAIYRDATCRNTVICTGLHGLIWCQCRGVCKCPGR
jgi:hypothetical protein